MKRAVVVGIVVAAALAAGGVAWWLLSRPPGPEDTARAYVEALAAGDGERALGLAESAGAEADRAGAFAGATEYLADPVVESVSAAGSGETRATVSFSLGGQERSATFGLVENDDGWVVVADGFGILDAATTLGDVVLAGGVMIPAGADVPLLPAVYPVQAAPTGILAGSTSAVVLFGERVDAEVEASVSPEATVLAQEQLDAYAAQCTQPAETVPPNCGLKVPWAADLAALTSIAFRIERSPAVTLSPDLRTFAATGGSIVATASGTTRSGSEASFSYRSDDWALRGTVTLTGDGMQLAVN